MIPDAAAPPPAPRAPRVWQHALRACSFVALFACACSFANEESAPAPARVHTTAETVFEPVPVVTACEEGATRECRITLNVRSGTVTCTTGIEECKDGSWSECFRTTDPEDEASE